MIPFGKQIQISPKQPLLLKAASLAQLHTFLAVTAFTTALVIGCYCHYRKIVKNSVAGYPEEWFPSVSATIGDWYPERSIFHVLIALTAGPRFSLVVLQYYLHQADKSCLPSFVFAAGLLRTLSCGGWVYITSTDDHDAHDIFMILYMVCNIPWMFGGIFCTPAIRSSVREKRKIITTCFFVTLVPLVYFFIRHKVHRIPGAYTRYSFCEWNLIIFDVLYDSVCAQEFAEAHLEIAVGSSLRVQDIPSAPISRGVVSVQSERAPQKSVPTLPEKPSLYKSSVASSSSNSLLKQQHRAVWRATIAFLSDVYLSYVFWSIFTSLIPTLFYFSVWELGIAGQELALLATWSPIFLGVPFIRRLANSKAGNIVLHLLSFIGLTAYALEDPLKRLITVTIASFLAILRQAMQWSAATGGDIVYQSILTTFGFLMSSLSKHANHSNNPIWPFIGQRSGGFNKTGITLALLALVELGSRSRSQNLLSGPSKKSESTRRPSGPWFPASIALGSLLFTMHNMLSDSSTLVAWSWTGYANGRPKGPLPHLHGFFTLLAQCIGLLLPLILSDSSILFSPVWFVVGCAGAFILYTCRDWVGYAGAIVFAVFLTSITPLLFQKAASVGNIPKTYFVAWVVACLFNLASIFTVAYAFVPGGNYFRERTGSVLIAQFACLAQVFHWPVSNQPKFVSSRPSTSQIAFSKAFLFFIVVLTAFVSIYRWPPPAQPFHPEGRVLNAGIWTVHFGIDNEGRDSQHGIRNLLRDMQLDVVGLLETDLHRTAFGHRDLTRVIAEDMGYYVDLGPGPNTHTWGAVLLSKFPVINSTHHLLPSPHGELAPAIEAVLDIYGTEVTVVVSHNGQEEDPLDRELQSIELARIMAAAAPRPLIFLGYVVTKPHAKRPAPYEILISDGQVYDIHKADLDRWCEYILYRGVYRTAYARLSRGIITDTELQVGQFVIPKHGTRFVEPPDDIRYQEVERDYHPPERWFPNTYFQSDGHGGVDGHFYHVFNKPLYYKLPEDAAL